MQNNLTPCNLTTRFNWAKFKSIAVRLPFEITTIIIVKSLVAHEILTLCCMLLYCCQLHNFSLASISQRVSFHVDNNNEVKSRSNDWPLILRVHHLAKKHLTFIHSYEC